VFPKQFILKFWNFWPPFFGAGIRIGEVSKDFRYVRVELKRRLWTSNYVGTQFGGSMFAMTDPFYMVMLIVNLGANYIVWDKSSSIRYLKPGRTKLTAEFKLSEEQLQEIKSRVDRDGKSDHILSVNIYDTEGVHVAAVEKTLYIRKKQP
jgi:acyl-coenzyme A thioesterase PaaI-like protein